MELRPEEISRREKLKLEKPLVYEKLQKIGVNGAISPIFHLQYRYNCNFKCEHCSIEGLQNKQNRRTVTPADIKRVADEAHELGLARSVITGGEPLIFPDLAELIQAIGPERFYINLDTNGWFLHAKKAKYLKELGVDRIQLSFDSLNAEEHDAFRNRPGSFKRSLEAIDNAKNAGLDIFLNSVVTKQRLYSDEFIEFIEYFNAKGVGVFVSFAKPVGSWEGNFDVLVNKDDMKYLEELEKKYKVFSHLTPAYGLNLGCIAVKGMITITQYGDVLPCQYIFTSIGNIFEEPLKDIIKRGMSIKYFGEHVDTCLIAEDIPFIEKYIAGRLYGKELPVPCEQVFDKEDFI